MPPKSKAASRVRTGSKTSAQTVAAVERALSILNAFRTGDVFLSLGELSARTGLYKSTILRLNQSLERHGYLVHDEHRGYAVGPSTLRLAAFYQASFRPDEVILPVLQHLVDKTSESAAFQVRVGDSRICVYRVESPHRLRDHLRPGDTLPLNRGAAGTLFLAFAQPHDPASERIRKQLVVTSVNQTAEGMAAIAVPIFDGANKVFGAIVLSGPATRFDSSANARFEPLMLAAARTVTAAVGGDPAVFDERLATAKAARRA